MPELPEVETIRRSLERDIIGKKIAGIEVRENKQFVGDKRKIIGQKIIALGRIGKVLHFKLNNDIYLNFHLKLAGEILYSKKRQGAHFANKLPRTHTNVLPNQHTRIIIDFADDSALFFNDLRKFGWVKITQIPKLSRAIDILSKSFTQDYLRKIISSTSKPIKVLLMEQDKLAGLGNIYTNDSLWQAKINPLRKSKTLTMRETVYLYKAIKKIIGQAIKYKGSSAKDEMYVLPDSSKGQYQHHMKVYRRDGQSCLRDGTLIKRIKLGGRGTFFCPKCQK